VLASPTVAGCQGLRSVGLVTGRNISDMTRNTDPNDKIPDIICINVTESGKE